MAVVVETTLGDITVDLYIKERPIACLNFLKLCKMKYYNYNLFHTVSRDFIAQTGDPTGSRKGGESIYGVLEGPLKRYFEAETNPRIKHTITGLISFVGADDNMIGSQFFITLASDLTYLDDRHCVFGEVSEGLDVLELLNDSICDTDSRPYQDIRITHTVVLDDPYPDMEKLRIPSRSPSPSAERMQGGRIAPDEEIDETVGKDGIEIEELKADREAKARATILEMVGDIPDAEMAPPENVLFVCKLNPVTTDDDLEIIFSRFGKINSCEVIRDRKTGDSLQYAFIEFNEKKSCEDAYFKMDNVLIDDRRIHIDFSQSVAKVKWLGKGRGVAHFDDRGHKTDDRKNDVGQGNYRSSQNRRKDDGESRGRDRDREQPARRDAERPREQHKFQRRREMARDHPQRSGRDRNRSPDRRNDRYYEDRRERDRYRPSDRPDRRERNYRPDERRDNYTRRSNEESRRWNRDRVPQESRSKPSRTVVSRNSPTNSEKMDQVKSKKKKKNSRSSSSDDATSEREDRKKSKAKTEGKKKKVESSSSSDSSEDDYRKKKKARTNKDKRKRNDSSDS